MKCVYGMCVVQIRKTVMRKMTRWILLQNMKSVLLKLREKSPLAKYWSVTANVIVGRIASRNFVSFFWVLWPIAWIKISKSLFVILKIFLNPEPSCILNSRRRLFPCWTSPLNKSRVQKPFAYFGRWLLPITNIQGVSRLDDITARGDFLGLCDQKNSYKHVYDFGRLRSYDRLKLGIEGNFTTWLNDWTRQAGVDIQYCMRSVADVVCRHCTRTVRNRFTYTCVFVNCTN